MDAHWLQLRYISISLPPIVFLTLSFALGIFVGHTHLPLWYPYLGFTFLACLILSLQKPVYAVVILCLCSLATAAGYYRIETTYLKERALSHFLESSPFELKGLVTDVCKIKSKRFKKKIGLSLDSIANGSKTVKPARTCELYLPYRSSVHVGQKITITGAMLMPQKRREQSNQAPLLRFSVPSSHAHIVDTKMSIGERLKSAVLSARYRIALRISSKLLPTTSTLFKWLFLGLSTHDEDVLYLKEHCKSWGISHYLARSGLHVGMMLMVWQSLLRHIPFPLLIKELLLLFILLITTVLSWPSISFSRAVSSYIFLKCYSLSRLSIHPFHVSFLTCFLFLCYNPLYLLSISFQLSFLGVFLLTWVQEIELLRKRPIDAQKNV